MLGGLDGWMVNVEWGRRTDWHGCLGQIAHAVLKLLDDIWSEVSLCEVAFSLGGRGYREDSGREGHGQREGL